MARPDTEAQLADLIRNSTTPLSIRGGATRGFLADGDPLDTSALHGVRLYEPGGLTLVVGAGTPLAEIDTILAEKGQRLAFEPMDHRPLLGTKGTPTIGGVAAANISGPRRFQAGAARDHMLGVRFVTGAGEIVKNGGRVMKNVTGYDLVKLMAGSHGTLGVLTEISLKVQAIPQAEATLILSGQTMSEACADLRAALATPWDVTGASFVGAGVSGETSQRAIRIEGMAQSVAYRCQCLRDRFGADTVLDSDESRAFWAGIRDVRDFAPTSGDQTPPAIWRISTAPSAAPAINGQLTAAGMAHSLIADWAGGLIWLRTPDMDPGSAKLIRDLVGEHGGHATLIRAKPAPRREVATFHPQSPALEKIAQGLRQKFDPHGILNPGLMDPTQ